jgi:thioredoxin 1
MSKLISIATLEELNNEIKKAKKTIIKFSTTWCGPCRMYSPIFKEVAEENTNPDVSFIEVSLDDAAEISREFDIVNVPLTIVIEEGKDNQRIPGVQTKNKLIELI